jgi:anti-anti-sigma factor
VTTATSEDRSGGAMADLRPVPELKIIRTGGAPASPRQAPPPGRTIVSVHGGLDLPAAPVLREQLIDVLNRSAGPLLLDLAHVSACDTAGLAVLIGTQRRARLLGITMSLVAPSRPVSDALRSTGLGRSFTVYPDVSGALAAQQPAPAPAEPGPSGVVLVGPWPA